MSGKIVIYAALVLAMLAFILNVFLQPDDLSLCPWNGGKPVTRNNCEKADAIVAVSGGDTEARTNRAIELYKQGWAEYIIFSGAAFDKTGPSNAEAMRLQAVKSDVPASKVLIEEFSDNTQQNAENTKKLLDYYDIDDVILVTSGYHQRRASIEFQRVATDVEIRNGPIRDKDWTWYWWITPKGWYLALSETTKSIIVMAGSSDT